MPQPHESRNPQAGRSALNLPANPADEPPFVAASALELPPLPYDYGALEPHISRRTMTFHHDKHHRAYVEKTLELVSGTELQGCDLPQIIRAARRKPDCTLLSQAGQAWNHNIFWLSMRPRGGGAPGGRLMSMIERDFGGLNGFKTAFRKEAVGHFASGWAWLVLEGGRLKVASYHDGHAPAGLDGLTPLVACDLWEHAYYLDYQNRREAFVDAFLDHLINWDFAAANLPAGA